MPVLDTPAGPLRYVAHDLTPPWIPEPETALFLHGVGIEHGIWARWLPILGARCRLVLMDMRGYGGSRPVAAGHEWSIEGLAEDALAVADAAGAERFHFIGESFGGAVGYWLAVHRRERLRTLTACTAPHNGARIRGLPDWRGIVEERGMEGWSAKMMESRFAPQAIRAAEWRWFDAAQRACDPGTVLGQADALLTVDMTGGLPGITTPTLAIGGDSSPVLPPPVLAETHALIPGAALRIFDGARHGVVLSHGEQAARTMLAFAEAQGA